MQPVRAKRGALLLGRTSTLPCARQANLEDKLREASKKQSDLMHRNERFKKEITKLRDTLRQCVAGPLLFTSHACQAFFYRCRAVSTQTLLLVAPSGAIRASPQVQRHGAS